MKKIVFIFLITFTLTPVSALNNSKIEKTVEIVINFEEPEYSHYKDKPELIQFKIVEDNTINHDVILEFSQENNWKFTLSEESFNKDEMEFLIWHIKSINYSYYKYDKKKTTANMNNNSNRIELYFSLEKASISITAHEGELDPKVSSSCFSAASLNIDELTYENLNFNLYDEEHKYIQTFNMEENGTIHFELPYGQYLVRNSSLNKEGEAEERTLPLAVEKVSNNIYHCIYKIDWYVPKQKKENPEEPKDENPKKENPKKENPLNREDSLIPKEDIEKPVMELPETGIEGSRTGISLSMIIIGVFIILWQEN